MKIVIDTNIFISSVLSNPPTIQAILEACRDGSVQLVTSKALLQELGRVLHKPKIAHIHRMSDECISRYLRSWSEVSEIVSGLSSMEITADPKDNMVFTTAFEGQADYIVSGDKKHVLSLETYGVIQTVSPSEFLAVLKLNEKKSEKSAA